MILVTVTTVLIHNIINYPSHYYRSFQISTQMYVLSTAIIIYVGTLQTYDTTNRPVQPGLAQPSFSMVNNGVVCQPTLEMYSIQ